VEHNFGKPYLFCFTARTDFFSFLTRQCHERSTLQRVRGAAV
jgi:hypothetical protein